MNKPFNFTNAKLANVRGKVNNSFPPIANKTARPNKAMIIKILKLFDIFFEEILLTILNKK